MTETSKPRYQAFLSHNSADKPAVEELARRLEKDGISCFLDKWHLIPGEPWQTALEEAIDHSECCVVFVGPSGLGPWQNEEMRAAIDRRVSTSGQRVVPVLLPGGQREQRSRLPPFLVSAMWVEFRSSTDEEDGYHRLKCGIRGIAPGPAAGAAIFQGECPYRGLQVFDADHARFFFGRDAQVDWILSRMADDFGTYQEGRFLGVIGASGSGKSSLVRAGLVPAILEGRSRSGKALPGSAEWPVVTLRPGAEPLKAIADTLWSHEVSRPLVADPPEFAVKLLEDARRLHWTIETLLTDTPQSRRFVIIVDQFEELFTQCASADEPQRKAFIDNLMYAAAAHRGRTLVVITMRADFYGKCSRYDNLAHALCDRQELVPPLGQPELRAAIEEPARMCGLELEPGLTELLLQGMREQPAGALPLLQQTLLMLWDRRDGRRLTIQAYRDMGEIEGALEAHANQIYENGLENDEQRDVCRRVLLMLTTPGEGTEDTRRRVPRSQLGSSKAVDSVLQQLIRGRLVTLSDTDPPRVEVTHEALIRGWTQLREWLDEDRDSLRILQQLMDAAEDWCAHDRDAGYLFAGSRLTQAEQWRSEHSDQLADIPLANEFIDVAVERRDADKRRREAEEQQRLEMLQNLAETERARAEAANLMLKKQAAIRRILIGSAGIAIALCAVAAVSWFLTLRANNNLENKKNELATTNQQLENTVDDLTKTQQALKTERDNLGLANQRLAEQTAIAQQNEADANAARDEKNRQLMHTERLLYASQITSAQREWETAKASRAWRHLDAAQWDLRGWEHDYLYTLFNQNQQTLRGHLASVYSVAVSPDGTRIASSSLGIKLWDASTGQETMHFGGFSPVDSVVFDPSGTRIAAAIGMMVKIWDATNGAEIRTFKGHTGRVNSVAFSHDGTRIVSAAQDKLVMVWDSENGSELLTLKGHTSPVNSVEFSPDGTRIVSGSGERTDITDGHLAVKVISTVGTVKVWDAATGKVTLTLKGHSAPVNSVAFHPTESQVVSGSDDQTVKVWDATSGNMLRTLEGHTGRVTCVTCSADGKRIVSGSEGGTIKLWAANSGLPLGTLRGHTDTVNSIAITADGTRMVSGADDRTVRLWDATRSQGALALDDHTDRVTSIAFSPDGTRIVTGSVDKSVRVWDAATGRMSLKLEGHTGTVNCVVFSPDSRQIISGGETIRVWDATSGRMLASFAGGGAPAISLSFSRDGETLLAGHVGRVKTWNTADWQETTSVKDNTNYVTRFAFSPDGTLAASIGRFTMTVLSVASGDEVVSVRGSAILDAAFSPDGTSLVSGTKGGAIKLLDAATGEERLSIQGYDGPIRSVSFNEDGARIISGNEDGTVKLWDTASGRELLTLSGNTSPVECVTASPDGKRIASVSQRAARVWNASTRQERLTLRGHTGPVTSVVFSRDGSRIVSGGRDETVRVWNTTTGRLERDIRARISVNGVAIAPDGTWIAGGGVGPMIRRQSGTIKVWETASGEEPVDVAGRHLGPVTGVAFNSDKTRIATVGNDGTLKVWDTASGQEQFSIQERLPMNGVAFSPDGSRIVAGGWTLKVWDTATGKEVLALIDDGGSVNGLAVSQNGTRIAAADGTKLRVWDASTGEQTLTIDGHGRPVRTVAFSPDGSRIASGAADHTVKLWDATTGAEKSTLRGHMGEVLSVAFSPDGSRVVSGGDDMTLRLWTVPGTGESHP